jgi:hypothetical protein
MTRQEAKKTLLKYFIDNFDLGYQVAYSNNEYFTKPSDEPWVRFMILNQNSDQRSYGAKGNRRFDRRGIIAYQVFIPANTGTYDGDTICEYINNLFEGERFSEIVCDQGIYEEIGITEEDTFQYNGSIFYKFDEKK